MGQKSVDLGGLEQNQNKKTPQSLPGLKKNFKKSEKSACFWPQVVYYINIMNDKKDLQTRINQAKKRMCLTLLDIFGIILTQTKENTLWVK